MALRRRRGNTWTMEQDLGANGPLSGFRVLDLTSVVMGPYATQQLGDLGADVIMVEPIAGASNRHMGPGAHDEFSGIALNILRNKRSLALDLKSPDGREALSRVIATCDVVITNLRPKPLVRLNLSYEDVAAIRPDIVYCQAQGFRTDGERADDPAYDDIIQAESGLADAAQRTGRPPSIAPTILADKVCGMAIAQAVLAALFHRERTGEGQRVEVPMLDVMRAFVLVEHGADAVARPLEGRAGYSRVLTKERGPQQTSDGWINILPYSTAAYDAMFIAGGRDDLVGDARTVSGAMAKNAEFLYAQLRPIIATRTTAEWLAFCKDHHVPVGTVATLDEVVGQLPIQEHPHAGPYRVISPPVVFDKTPSRVWRTAPVIGQDTADVLIEAGYTSAEVEALNQSGAVRVAG
jgi:crotonobetainyl-CoA:carnitine CoA-transferase CaiB-like acyl-CoA transferase